VKSILVVEAIGDDKVRVNHQSLDSPLIILADQALEIIAAGKSLHIARAPPSAEYIDVEPTGLADARPGGQLAMRAMCHCAITGPLKPRGFQSSNRTIAPPGRFRRMSR
jgi:hypothetical protein